MSRTLRALTGAALLAGALVPALPPLAAGASATATTAATATTTTTTTTATTVRIDAGGSSSTAGADARAWSADAGATGGAVARTSAAIAGTTDDALYQSVRWGMQRYAVPVARRGVYRVTLHVAETAFRSAGKRVFSVTGEGAPVVTDLDVYRVAGANTAHTVSKDLQVLDGVLDLGFTARVDNAMLAALEVELLRPVEPPVGVGSQFHCMWSGASGYGTYAFDAQRAAVLDKLVEAGVRTVRIDVGWDGLQPTATALPDPANWYVKLLDGCVAGARARGLEVLLTLDRSPAWARPTAYASTARVLPADPARIRPVAGWLAARYATSVSAIEVWNEPNLKDFVQVVDPAKYVAVLKAAHGAIKAAAPGMQVVFSGADRVAVRPGAAPVDDFYSLAYAAGAKGAFDVMGVHTYQGASNEAPDAPDIGTWRILHMPALLDLMRANGDGAKPVWVTEFGWSVHPNAAGAPSWALGVTEQQQADYTVRAFDIFARWPQVQRAFVYAERQKQTGDAHQDGYGILRRDLTPRPLFTALVARR
ncbi:malectin domain-containing carbohydrate-binding protein [Vallicoccus soli]|uniref:malectin domain-containing carbohydrate-binding protein n=1 Tax=Vallicoccus soli TaxID=2339232 RepID=UPI0015AEE377|nr:malectin domain-containing carbohydrate-binding protein [Vallicoccus soli]